MLARAGAAAARRRRAGRMRSSGTACARSPTRRPGELRLESRNLNDITDRYPELARLDRALGSHARSSTARSSPSTSAGGRASPRCSSACTCGSRAQAEAPGEGHARHVHDLRPAVARRPLADGAALRASAASVSPRSRSSGERWQTPEHLVGQRRRDALLQASAEQGLEGIVAKRLDSTYQPGLRTRDWMKIKNARRARSSWSAAGCRARAGAGASIGALLLGVHEPDGALRYAGRVGSGFSDAELDRLAALLAPLRARRARRSPAGEQPPRGAVFCEPRLVAEVEFSEWTAQRQPAPPRATRACARTRRRGRSCARTTAPRKACARTPGRSRSAEKGAAAADATVAGRS